MSEAVRSFWSEYRKVTPKVGNWARLGGQAPVTYQEACEEISLEMEHDLRVGGDVTYEYRIMRDDKAVVMRTSVPSAPIAVDSGDEAFLKEYPREEILRRWKIVDSMIEELDEEKSDREETLKELKLQVDTSNYFWTEVTGKLLTEQNNKIFELERYLKIGSDDGEN